MSDAEMIGPIQMGLNKPVHFTDIESSVRDIVNITAVAVIDAIVAKKIETKESGNTQIHYKKTARETGPFF